MERGVEGTRTEEAELEVEAEVGGALAVVEVVGGEAGEGVGLGEGKGLLDGMAIRVKDSVQEGSGSVVFGEDLNGGEYLFVGVGLDGQTVLAGHIGGRTVVSVARIGGFVQGQAMLQHLCFMGFLTRREKKKLLNFIYHFSSLVIPKSLSQQALYIASLQLSNIEAQ